MENGRRYGLVNGLVGASAGDLQRDSQTPQAVLGGRPLLSNRGIPLNLDWVRQARVNTSAVERRAQTHVARRTVKKEWQAAWLLRAITCMDLTTLSGDDTDERVRRLCAKAKQPIQHDVVQQLGIDDLKIQVAAVCVYHRFVETARRAVEGSSVKVAAVSTGFPAGLSPLSERVAEIRRSVEAGADEIDVEHIQPSTVPPLAVDKARLELRYRLNVLSVPDPGFSQLPSGLTQSRIVPSVLYVGDPPRAGTQDPG